jgi:hypothetical protein
LQKYEHLLPQFRGRQEPEETALQQQQTEQHKRKSPHVFFISIPVVARA